MKWFKHLVDSGSDPDLQEAVYLFGPEAYYIFFRTLEILAREYKDETPGENTFLYETYRKNYQVSSRKLLETLEFFHEKNRILMKVFKEKKYLYIKLKCPKLVELTEQTSTKRVQKHRERKRFGNVSETFQGDGMEQTDREVEGEGEVDTDKVRKEIDSSLKHTEYEPGSEASPPKNFEFQKKIYSEVIELLKKIGIPGDQAYTMVSTGTAEYIFRKILYLQFYQENPAANGNGGIEKPVGWLIRACEDNYEAPMGFMAWVNRKLESWLDDEKLPECVKKEIKIIAEGSE
jgi:hypothetical protein